MNIKKVFISVVVSILCVIVLFSFLLFFVFLLTWNDSIAIILLILMLIAVLSYGIYEAIK